MAPSQQGVVGGGRSMSESDLREDEEEDEEEHNDERRRQRRGQDRVRGRSYEQLDSLTLPIIAPRRPPRTYPPPPGQLTRAPSQATRHLTTVTQVIFSFHFLMKLDSL